MTLVSMGYPGGCVVCYAAVLAIRALYGVRSVAAWIARARIAPLLFEPMTAQDLERYGAPFLRTPENVKVVGVVPVARRVLLHFLRFA